MKTTKDKLERARVNEAAKLAELHRAALEFAEQRDLGPASRARTNILLQVAAKAWTNACHERSRQEKRLAEGK